MENLFLIYLYTWLLESERLGVSAQPDGDHSGCRGKEENVEHMGQYNRNSLGQ